MNKLIVAAVLMVGILLPAFGAGVQIDEGQYGEEIQIDETELIGTWKVTIIGAVAYFENELDIEVDSTSILTFPISFETGGFSNLGGANLLWSLNDNRLLLVGLTGGMTWMLVPLDKRSFLALGNAKDFSGETWDEVPVGVVLFKMIRVSETDEWHTMNIMCHHTK